MPIAIAESALDPNAQSHCKAQGLLQIMPNTFDEIKRKNKWTDYDVFIPEHNVVSGIYYDRQLYNNWRSKRPENDRIALMMASYNAGLGNPLKAQRLCIAKKDTKQNCNLWSDIRIYAPKVNTWIYSESLNYVNKIFRFMDEEY